MTDPYVQWSGRPVETSSSLIVRLKQEDQDAWRSFVHVYGPLVFTWCRRAGLQDADAADVGQDVFRTVSRSIVGVKFDQPGGSFRGWLRTVTRSRILDFLRLKERTVGPAAGAVSQTELSEQAAALDELDDSEENSDQILVRRAVDLVLAGCKENTRQAFLRVVIEGQHPLDVANDLGMTVNAVYVAKSHVIREVREMIGDVVDI